MRYLQHGEAEIRSHHLGVWTGFAKGDEQVATAGGQIENTSRRVNRDHAGGAGAPEKIHASAQKVIGKIVTPGNGAEGALHEAGVLLWQMRFDAEKIRVIIENAKSHFRGSCKCMVGGRALTGQSNRSFHSLGVCERNVFADSIPVLNRNGAHERIIHGFAMALHLGCAKRKRADAQGSRTEVLILSVFLDSLSLLV